LKPLKDHFNRQKGRLKFIALLSPSVPYCREGAIAIRKSIINKFPKAGPASPPSRSRRLRQMQRQAAVTPFASWSRKSPFPFFDHLTPWLSSTLGRRSANGYRRIPLSFPQLPRPSLLRF